MRKKERQKKRAASVNTEAQRSAQEAIRILQRLLDEDGCDPMCGAICAAGRLGGAAHFVLHDGDKKQEDGVDALLAKMDAWLAAQKEAKRLSIAFIATSVLADRLAKTIIQHDKEMFDSEQGLPATQASSKPPRDAQPAPKEWIN